MQSVRFIRNITKVYPEKTLVTVYKKPNIFVKTDVTKRKREEVNEEDYIPKLSSIRRTQAIIKDLVLCNDFELFCTFTFNPEKVDSFKLMSAWCVMQRWLIHQRDNSREKGKQLKYLVIPEMHKSGRWHFHALISGYTGTLKFSGHRSKNRPIYNITSFRSGFTTAVPIDNDSRDRVSSYITKYITKDMIKSYNQRRYFASNNLNRPKRELNSHVFSQTLPIFRRHVSSNSYTDTFVIDNSVLDCYNETDF